MLKFVAAAPASLSPDTSSAEPLRAPAGPDRKAFLADTLRQRIRTMTLGPGSTLDEVALAAEFGLSRPPVRELLRELAAEGYIVLEANRPARVSPMSLESLRSFFMAAPLIYIATTQLAAGCATAADIQTLQDIQAGFRHAIDEGDVQRRVACNDRFHLQIGLIARNPYLMPSLRRLLIDHARLGQTFYRPGSHEHAREDMETAARQHDQIIEAIARHDAEAAGELIRAHWALSRRRMSDYVVPEGIEVPLT